MLRVLIVDDESTLRLTAKAALAGRNYSIDEADNGLKAVELVKTKGPYDVVLLDVNMPVMSGLEALKQIKETQPKTVCLMLTAFSNIKDAVESIKYGAFDYVEKPVDSQHILKMIDAACEANALVEAVAHSAPQLNFDEGRKIIGSSTSIQQVFDIVYKLSKVDTAVLVRGESGTGKELIARAIHVNSPCKKGPFVALNCAAIPDNLIESELFGHEKGAFTGADKRKLGRFQFADGGTLFLDEIGDISSQVQVKLLRALQEKVITPIGSSQEIKVNVRVIAATNRPLEKMIQEGKYRDDLFYRLNVLPILLPPLRDRREDIESLTTFMIKKFNKQHSRKVTGIAKDALSKLLVYSWPGNIRELENVIERAFIIETGDKLTMASLPTHIAGTFVADKASNSDELGTQDIFADAEDLNYPALKEKFEKEFIVRALKAFNGRINQTAEHTKMTKVTLLRKLNKFQINPKNYQQPRT